MKSADTNYLEKLSNREFEVLDLLCDGFSRERIADRLSISKLTYDSYRKSIREKLGIRNQSDWGKVMYKFSQSNLNQ